MLLYIAVGQQPGYGLPALQIFFDFDDNGTYDHPPSPPCTSNFSDI